MAMERFAQEVRELARDLVGVACCATRETQQRNTMAECHAELANPKRRCNPACLLSKVFIRRHGCAFAHATALGPGFTIVVACCAPKETQHAQQQRGAPGARGRSRSRTVLRCCAPRGTQQRNTMRGRLRCPVRTKFVRRKGRDSFSLLLGVALPTGWRTFHAGSPRPIRRQAGSCCVVAFP